MYLATRPGYQVIKTKKTFYTCSFVGKGPFKYYVIKEVGGGGQMLMFADKMGGRGQMLTRAKNKKKKISEEKTFL